MKRNLAVLIGPALVIGMVASLPGCGKKEEAGTAAAGGGGGPAAKAELQRPLTQEDVLGSEWQLGESVLRFGEGGTLYIDGEPRGQWQMRQTMLNIRIDGKPTMAMVMGQTISLDGARLERLN